MMEYQKIKNLLDKYTKNRMEINNQSRGVYYANSDIRSKTTMLKCRLCNCSDAYILIKQRITITGARADVAARQVDERNKGFKGCSIY